MSKKKMTLRELQMLEYEILKVFHDFCVKNELRYYLCGGTLIGAVRHKGFIPWDDDIDIMMPRPDYMRLIELNKSGKLDSYRKLDHYSLNQNALSSILRIYDVRTQLVFTSHRIKKKFGCWIDIFPLDGLSDSWINRKVHFKEARIITDLMICNDTKFGQKRRSKWISILQYLLLPFLPMIYLIGHDRLIKMMDQVSRKYPYEFSDYVGVLGGRAGYKEAMLKNNMEPSVLVDFEGGKFFAMNNYHEYLTNLYGDYMTLPPEDERVSRHKIDIYWKNKS